MIHGKQDFDKDPVAHQASIADQVPIIDIAELLVDSNSGAARDSIDKIASACSSWGFFQVINHGLTTELVDDVWRQTRAFFALPNEIKRSVLRGTHLNLFRRHWAMMSAALGTKSSSWECNPWFFMACLRVAECTPGSSSDPRTVV